MRFSFVAHDHRNTKMEAMAGVIFSVVEVVVEWAFKNVGYRHLIRGLTPTECRTLKTVPIKCSLKASESGFQLCGRVVKPARVNALAHFEASLVPSIRNIYFFVVGATAAVLQRHKSALQENTVCCVY